MTDHDWMTYLDEGGIPHWDLYWCKACGIYSFSPKKAVLINDYLGTRIVRRRYFTDVRLNSVCGEVMLVNEVDEISCADAVIKDILE